LNRRWLTHAAGGAALLWSLATRAQAAKMIVALVFPDGPSATLAGPDPTNPLARAFVHALRDLGWIEGRNVVIERWSAEGQPERVPAIFSALIARRVDVIVVTGNLWLMHAAQQATRDIPIVALFNVNPVTERLVTSLGRPGGNLTGLTILTGHEMQEKRLQLLKEVAPRIARVAFLGQQQHLDANRSVARSFGVSGSFVEVDRSDQFDAALATILRERADAVHILGSSILYTRASRIAAFAFEHRLPTMFGYREAVEAGGLMSYGASVPSLFRQMAGYVDRILKGARPAELPIEQPTRFELVVNLKTAKALGITIPYSVMLRTDEVIQ
jgi:putative tryptophan/tyrosine transport system substrate-binding protein